MNESSDLDEETRQRVIAPSRVRIARFTQSPPRGIVTTQDHMALSQAELLDQALMDEEW
jgi:hypothetical protein